MTGSPTPSTQRMRPQLRQRRYRNCARRAASIGLYEPQRNLIRRSHAPSCQRGFPAASPGVRRRRTMLTKALGRLRSVNIIATLVLFISLSGALPSAYASESSSQCPSGLGARSALAPESALSAQADAVAMLGEVSLPPGSSESASDPAEAGSLLAAPGFGPPGTPNAVDEHAWWLVPASPAETLAYICAHLPHGTTQPMTFGGGLTGDVPENMIAAFTWPSSAGTLAVWVVRRANGSTALRVDAEVVWVIPRPAAARIPASARLLTISVHKSGRTLIGIESKRLAVLRRLPSRVTSIARIKRVVAMLNELSVHQPGIRHCPMEPGASVQLSFYTRPSASPLAIADISTAGCGGVSLTVDKIAEPELEGGWSLVEEISRTLETRPAPKKRGRAAWR